MTGLTAPVPPASAAGRTAALVLALGLQAVLLASGCRPAVDDHPPAEPPTVTVTAYLARSCPGTQDTIAQLERLGSDHPHALTVEIVDIDDAEGVRRCQEAGLDSSALVINGATTLAWGRGAERRTVSFLYPPGLAWTCADLRGAVEAGIAGELVAAAPEEARAVRLIPANVRAQAVRAGQNGAETGQLVINDQIVLEVTEPCDDLAPGQRVALAAEGLSTVLRRPFTPDQLRIHPVEQGLGLNAGDQPLLVATAADARGGEQTVEELANEWRCAVRNALVRAALAGG